MKHKEKVRLARKLRTHKELKDRVPIFQTKAWEIRKKAIERRIIKKIKKIQKI